MRSRDLGAQRLDLAGVAEAVEDDVAALRRERFGNALTDAAGGSGDESGLASKHGFNPFY
jgi:hypothetical protein